MADGQTKRKLKVKELGTQWTVGLWWIKPRKDFLDSTSIVWEICKDKEKGACLLEELNSK